jgi:predicted 2-oxoglutarate/Fe(II)-dependent dioxygenase YbiX
MDDRKYEAATNRERAQEVLWIADMVKRDDARKILFQIAAEYRDRARQLEEIINAEEAVKAAGKGG